MKVAASVAIAAAALGVSAHPSGHAHMHKGRDFVVANKPVTTTVYAVEAAAATTTSSTAAESTPSSSSGSSSSEYVEFCSGSSNSKRATIAEIASVGNIGTSDDYGCNLMTVDESIADLYTYTVTFNNDVDEDQACVCWNKIGPDGTSINGFWSGNQAVNFTLPASGTVVLAAEADSQGGCACTVGTEVELAYYGAFASTWLEFDFGSSDNNGWSGADASCLVSEDNNAKSGVASVHIPALTICTKSGSEDCSIINTGGSGTNAYTKGTEAADGIGLNLNTEKVRLVATVGN